MKKLGLFVAMIVMVGFFSGCVSDKVYKTGKIIYKGAKTAYIELDIESDKLKSIDSVVVSYDEARETIRGKKK
jgi:hypothetical protein